MHNLPMIESIRAVLDQPLGEELRVLLQDRLADTIRCGLQDLTHILVVEAGDTEQQIIEAVGFSPFVSRIDGVRNSVDWDWIERHDGWWELLYCVGDSGFAFVLLVEDADGSPFAQLCRREGAG
ncbi:hypothetical protein [Erythrobacter sp.]|uniref:hypothetical protein n=1 Tax=Erythrobacter sp. TaxID=1042 RepID=UPI0025F61AD3|nr:hypothetical protein [Erythrobacter sp.]